MANQSNPLVTKLAPNNKTTKVIMQIRQKVKDYHKDANMTCALK